jgi:[glutamine synthetase] adenylyltransferase / [glutamine synthetase]-adenylyl-L-tyrosine phosphorylase
MFGQMRAQEAWISKLAEASFDPARVETALLGLLRRWEARSPSLREIISGFPLGEENLIHLLAVSDVSALRLQADPEILLWLSRREVVMAPRGYAEMLRDLQRMADEAIAANNFRALRIWKAREMVRIAIREIANAARLEQTTAELSHIAEICVRSVYDHWNDEFRTKYGSPKSQFAILALGKLGGRELNYSSDVDLIFLYDEEGDLTPRLSYHEFFNRLGKKILQTFSAPSPEGVFLRVDLRLRPEGSAGPLARSLESMEHYYGGFGETWERLALIKARSIAGSRETAYEFLRQHQPFIYPKSPTPDLLAEIANIKKRIERDVVGAEDLHRNVKLGRGGIREIEFVVQTLQFIHGARHAFLQETGTLKALRGLAELELIPRKEILDLDRAYRFLRNTEHRLQIRGEQQTHTVPTDLPELDRLARSLGFADSEAFTLKLRAEMDAVRLIFDRVIAAAPDGSSRDGGGFEFFTNPAQAEKNALAALQGPDGRHVSARTRQVYAKLRPLLLDQLRRAADPDSTLTHFVRFVEAYGMRGSLFELLVTNPKLLELLIRLFDLSRFGANVLIRRPQFLEEITRDERLGRALGVTEHLERLKTLAGGSDDLEPLRGYRQRQILRIMLRDVLGWSADETLFEELSALADACLIFATRAFGGEDLTVVAMGKFGGSEISYGADLDVLFVGGEPTAAQRIVAGFSTRTAEGSLPRVDARLRPEGEKGPLTVSLEAFSSYYGSRAQFWELQALGRARPLTGRWSKEFLEVAKNAWGKADREIVSHIHAMLERIQRDRGTGDDHLDFKTGHGGIIEAEFLVQALQMKAGIWQPNLAKAIEALVQKGDFTQKEAEELKRAYRFLRECETVLRRQDDTAVSTLPRETDEQLKLSRRLGFDAVDEFAARYSEARATIRRVYAAKTEKE